MLLQISNIKINVTIGIYDWEKVIKRRLLIDLFFDFKEDVFLSFLDYDTVLSILENASKDISFDLMEDFGEYVLNLFKIVYPNICHYRVIVKKLAICDLFPYATIEKDFLNVDNNS